MRNGYQNGRKIEPYHNIGTEVSSSDSQVNVNTTPGQQAIVLAALFIGLLFLGVQLWLLTVALDLFLSNQSGPIWLLPIISGLIFVGGLVALRMLKRQRPPRT